MVKKQADKENITTSEIGKVEERLRESDGRYRALIESASDQIFVFDEGYKVISMNSAAAMLSGKKPDEMIGKHISEIFSKEMASRNMNNLETVFKTGKNYSIEEELNVSGHKLYVSTILSPVKNIEGKTTAVLGIVRNFTERKGMEEALRAAETRIRGLMNAVPVGISLSTPDGHLVEANDELWKMFGYGSREEYLKVPAIEHYFDPKDREILGELRKKGPVFDHEIRFKRKDGAVIWGSVNSIEEKSPDGKIYFVSSMLDITERKEAEGILRDSEEKFKALLDSAPDAFFIYDGKGVFVDGNKAAEKLSGYNRDELIGKSFLKVNLLPPDQLVKGMVDLAKNAMGIRTEAREYTLNRKDGVKVLCEINSTPIKIKGRNYILGIARDLTERKKAEISLKETDEKFKAIFDNANDGFLLAGVKDKKFILGNKAICEMTGYTPEEIKALGLMDIHPEKDLPYIIDQFEKQARNEIEVAENLPVKRKDGSVFYADVNASPVTLLGEDYLLGVFRDTTERKAAESVREELLHKVEDANRKKTEYVSDVSHELRTPLASIKGFVSTIRSDPAMDEPTRQDFLRIIEEETDRLTRIIEDLLDISRIESGRIKLSMRSFNIMDLITKNIENIKPLAESKGIVIQSHPAPAPYIVYADQDKTSQIIINILSNAIKYNKAGGKVSIAASDDDGKVRVDIEDTGIGISEKDLPHMFEKFFRAEGSSRETPGTGLGLAVTKSLVQVMGGEIEMQSKLGEGSRFSFSLPKCAGEQKEKMNERA